MLHQLPASGVAWPHLQVSRVSPLACQILLVYQLFSLVPTPVELQSCLCIEGAGERKKAKIDARYRGYWAGEYVGTSRDGEVKVAGVSAQAWKENVEGCA